MGVISTKKLRVKNLKKKKKKERKEKKIENKNPSYQVDCVRSGRMTTRCLILEISRAFVIAENLTGLFISTPRRFLNFSVLKRFLKKKIFFFLFIHYFFFILFFTIQVQFLLRFSSCNLPPITNCTCIVSPISWLGSIDFCYLK